MKRLRLDKIASVTQRLALDPGAVLGTDIPARAGIVIAARVLNAKSEYNTLEDVSGRMVTLRPGDVIAGALGHRDALYGYSGRVPETVAVGDTLQLLNLGGVIGAASSESSHGGEPFQLEVLGSVLAFPYLGTRVGVPADIATVALPATALAASPSPPPIVCLLGTCMDAGKTTAAAVVIGELVRRGLRVAAGKLTGVSLRRDVLHMQDCRASPALVFTDFGVVTTDRTNVVSAAHSLVSHLGESTPDAMVLEMGDGLLGTYGVDALLEDPALGGAIRSTVLCAQDPVGAWGAVHILRERFDLPVHVVSGRVTDGPTGRRYCQEALELPAHNALSDGPGLARAVLESLALEGLES